MSAKVSFALIALSAVQTTLCILFLPVDCPASTDCTCNHGDIDCRSRNLTTTPRFNDNGAWMMAPLTIDLSNNAINLVPNHAFVNLTSYLHGNEVHLYLQHNNLSDGSIRVHAFNGIAATLTEIVVDNNHLKTIPKAFTTLDHLTRLSMVNNPISTIDPLSMLSLGRTLLGLNVSMPGLHTWPVAFQYLRTLTELRVHDFLYDIPYNAFHGFVYTLRKLELSNTRFSSFPTSVCNLANLVELTISRNRNYTGARLAHCIPPLTSVTSFHFTDTLDHFPNIFRTFPNVSSLRIDTSNIRFIDDTVIPPYSAITTFELSHSKLTSFPGAVNAFNYLQTCDLHSNQIHTVESYSIGHLPNLTTLNLNNNPLQFISNVAFMRVPSLREVYLKGTQLTTIPHTVAPLGQLVTLDMRGDSVNCDCDSHWMKAWSRGGHVTVAGTCKLSQETIAEFINITLPLCP